MRVEEFVGRGRWSVLIEREVNQLKPCLSDGFVIATIDRFRNLVRGVEAFDSFSDQDSDFVEREAAQVKIGGFDVLAMMPIFNRPRAIFESVEKGFVVHIGDTTRDGAAGSLSCLLFPVNLLRLRKKRLEKLNGVAGGVAHVPNELAEADLS
jgi:hypothetical protein